MIYKNYEIFYDPSYYDMCAVRPVGNKIFDETNHFITMDECKQFVDNQYIIHNIVTDKIDLDSLDKVTNNVENSMVHLLYQQ